MSMQVKGASGNKKVFLQIGQTSRTTRRGIRQGWFEVGRDLTKGARRSIIEGPKTGRLYRIKGRKRRHRASAPNQSPANLTGALQKSINFKIHGWQRMEFNANEDYAGYLEFGTKFIKPRPFMIRQILKRQRDTEKRVEATIRLNLTEGS